MNEKEIVEKLEEIKKEIDEIKAKIVNLGHEEDIKKLFDEITKVVNDDRVRSIIFLSGNMIKYISKDSSPNAYRNVLIIGKRLYNWNDYKNEGGIIRITYTNEYEISDEIVNLIQKVPESDTEHLEPYYFNFYHFVKNGLPIVLVKG